MKRDWRRIERWLARHAPQILGQMRPGASATLVRGVERLIGRAFPSPVREWYQLHDGARGAALLGYWSLFSLPEAISAWGMLKSLLDDGHFAGLKGKPVGPARRDWWHPMWFPIAGDERGDYLCLDLAPTSRGQRGQLIRWYHDDSPREVIASSFSVWLRDLANGLEAGEYKLDTDGVLVKIGSLDDR